MPRTHHSRLIRLERLLRKTVAQLDASKAHLDESVGSRSMSPRFWRDSWNAPMRPANCRSHSEIGSLLGLAEETVVRAMRTLPGTSAAVAARQTADVRHCTSLEILLRQRAHT
jgi:hypothetical protein